MIAMVDHKSLSLKTGSLSPLPNILLELNVSVITSNYTPNKLQKMEAIFLDI